MIQEAEESGKSLLEVSGEVMFLTWGQEGCYGFLKSISFLRNREVFHIEEQLVLKE